MVIWVVWVLLGGPRSPVGDDEETSSGGGYLICPVMSSIKSIEAAQT